MNEYPLLYGQGFYQLTEVTPGQRLHPQASNAYLQMADSASEDGIELALYSSYRSFNTQLNIWNQKWNGNRPLLDEQSHVLDPSQLDDEAKLWAILRWSALPGASRHHWGSDMDVYAPNLLSQQETFSLIPTSYQVGGSQHTLANWLNQHARQFGFFLPYARDLGGTAIEPWHISFAPVAQTCQNVHRFITLQKIIETSEISGKAVILSLLPEIYQRYFCRICDPL
ncbi:M15 family metallopeptidase [Celerinatantimonas yamalensis]|uniref:M15 family metallopeptidase n=1 Tax=Celerinatantimonas yamalensis TaxID=559956 RepID=A0ABW9G485_9GAMM